MMAVQKLSEFDCHNSFEQDQRKEVRSSANILSATPDLKSRAAEA